MRMSQEEAARLQAEAEGRANGDRRTDQELSVVTAEAFAAVEEPGAEPIVGEGGEVLIPSGGDVMFYGDGGAGKTTLSIDFAFHLAAGCDWLGFKVRKPVRVLVIECEGPRSLLRQKFARKLAAWTGPSLEGRAMIVEKPWAAFSFATPEWRAKLADVVRKREIDVLIAGPLTRIGMDAAGTLQEVAAFMRFVGDLREQSGRLLTLVLTHHENKGGTVSGAWEGAGDTLFHVQARGHGSTAVFVQKARWSSAAHGTTLDLIWTDGEGFRIKEERNHLAEILKLLEDGNWRTVNDMREALGVGADTIRKVVDDEHEERFDMATGAAAVRLGRKHNAKLYQVRSC